MLRLDSLILLLLIINTLGIQFANSQVNFKDISCYFENNSFCGWTPRVTPAVDEWRIKSSNEKNISITGPVHGEFIDFSQFVYKDNSQKTSITAKLTSPLIMPTSFVGCFEFDYYLFGDVEKLQLYLINSQETLLLWERLGSHGDMFHTVYITIPVQKSFEINQTQNIFQLEFSAQLITGAIAIQAPLAANQSCDWKSKGRSTWDFEDRTSDKWQMTSDNNTYHWHIIKADEKETYDHTTNTYNGHLAETTSGGNIGDRAIIRSVTYNKGDYCLSFWFRRRIGSDLLEVKLETKYPNSTTTFWSSEHLQYSNSEWHIAKVTIKIQSENSSVIAIYATKKTLQESTIDLDDISLMNSSCPTPVTCNFNKDLCGWSHDSSTNSFWNQGFGKVVNDKKLKFNSPPDDHAAPKKGMILYTDFTELTPRITKTAQLYSEIVKPTNTVESCFTFWYLVRTLNTRGSGFEVHLTDAKNNYLSTLWRYDRNEDSNYGKEIKNQHWLNVQRKIITQTQFRIFFKVYTNDSSTYIAVDNIIYNSSQCYASTVFATIMPPSTPALPSKNLSCNFDYGSFCNWENSDTQPWLINNLITKNQDPIFPNSDKSKQSSTGLYIYIYHNRNTSTRETKAFISINETNNSNEKKCSCLQFWYYMRTSLTTNLSITIPKTRYSNIMWNKNGDKGEGWHWVQLDYCLGKKFTSTITINGLVKDGIIAIDDIKSCSENGENEIIYCTLEESDHEGCDWYVRGFPIVHWRQMKGSETSLKITDHTYKTISGSVLAVDFSENTLNIPIETDIHFGHYYDPIKIGCISFWYYMSKLTNQFLYFGILQDQSKENFSWYAVGEQGPLWYQHRVTISSTQRWSAVFRATGQGKSGIIAIDDITIDFTRACPTKSDYCNFENGDACAWENIPPEIYQATAQEKQQWSNFPIRTHVENIVVLQADFTWTIHSPIHTGGQPSVDHTTGLQTGNYLYMRNDATNKPYSRAVIRSDRYDVKGTNELCLHFWYYITNTTAPVGRRSKIEIYQSQSYEMATKIHSFDAPTSEWTKAIIPLESNSLLSSPKKIFVYIVGMTGVNQDENHIAIDDISFSKKCVFYNGTSLVTKCIFILVAVFILIFFIGLIVGGFFYFRKHNSTDSTIFEQEREALNGSMSKG